MRLRSSISNLKRCSGVYAASFFLCFIFFPGLALALISDEPADSLKSKYSITDLRNPLCACHLYQQSAEKEFEKILKNETARADHKNVAKNIKAGRNKLKISVTKRAKRSFWKPKKHKTFTSKKRKGRKWFPAFFFKHDVASC
jgi:hypothetical protein